MDYELIKQCFNYDPKTGSLIWKFREDRDKSWNTRYADKEALSSLNGRGYLCGSFLGKTQKKHRIIWIWMTGKLPKYIDHIDHNKTNNCWDNLREVSKIENDRNQSLRQSNKSGYSGVYWDKSRNKWSVRCGNKSYGRFCDLEDAVSRRRQLEKEFNYHPNHGVNIGSIDT